MPSLRLQAAYLGPTAYYSALARATGATIEQHDSYHKQTYRNRCLIGAADGVTALTIPVERTGEKQLTRDVRISYQADWQRQHWQAIRSAYGQTPFFDYYEDDFRPFFQRRWDYLIDFDLCLMEKVMELLDVDTPVSLSDTFTLSDGETDLRDAFNAKRHDRQPMPPYYQVFTARHGFEPNLSVIDLLFNLGPEGLIYLTTS